VAFQSPDSEAQVDETPMASAEPSALRSSLRPQVEILVAQADRN
jgi:hypothetical protein